jgi:hypothetical protein
MADQRPTAWSTSLGKLFSPLDLRVLALQAIFSHADPSIVS